MENADAWAEDARGRSAQRRTAGALRARIAGRLTGDACARATHAADVDSYLELILSEQAGALNEEQRHFLEVVERNARRLARTAEEIDFLSGEESRQQPSEEPAAGD